MGALPAGRGLRSRRVFGIEENFPADLWHGDRCRLVARICARFVGSASISWNACVPTAASTTGAASAAVSVRPHCGQGATDGTQKMVSGPRRPREGLWAWPCPETRSWKVEGN